MHLLAHLYAARNAPLWKDSALGEWFSTQCHSVIDGLETGRITRLTPSSSPIPTAWARETGGIPLWLVRHAFLSESYMGWIPPPIAAKLGHAYDPLPPTTGVTFYDEYYRHGLRSQDATSSPSSYHGAGGVGGFDGLIDAVQHILPHVNPERIQTILQTSFNALIRTTEYQEAERAAQQGDVVMQHQLVQNVGA